MAIAIKQEKKGSFSFRINLNNFNTTTAKLKGRVKFLSVYVPIYVPLLSS